MSEKVGTFRAEHVMGHGIILVVSDAEDTSMLRVHGLRKPIHEKTKEIKAANARSASSLDTTMFQIAQNELLTTDILYYQAAANLQVKADVDAAKRRISELEKEVKDLKATLEPLKEADSEAAGLRTRVDKLKARLQNQDVLEEEEEEEEESSDSAEGSDQVGEQEAEEDQELAGEEKDVAADTEKPPPEA
ncbi:death domain-associated protein 6-like [Chenopodium quinoa]|uniref:death domain-associated protein 6-like n=1 Tax=Chenopodium quinoa TaxID=63459 RepID=UPI000B785E52|nr:death domain-associated protein 6-like [Chenopodium quinoa]